MPIKFTSGKATITEIRSWLSIGPFKLVTGKATISETPSTTPDNSNATTADSKNKPAP